MITIILEVQYFTITASKNGEYDTVKKELEIYIEEAHYFPDENPDVIANDLKDTLELDQCFVQRKETYVH
jgi:hypothetical protein